MDPKWNPVIVTFFQTYFGSKWFYPKNQIKVILAFKIDIQVAIDNFLWYNDLYIL